jgi:two-component system, chemotaxis family, chemotaxis protein CheY
MTDSMSKKGEPAMKRILVVDDAATVRMFHRQVLEAEGLVVEEAVNGIEALEKALGTDFDLFLVDINMPRMNGYALVSQLRANSQIRQVPVVMISTEAERHDAARAYVTGANFYIVKPCAPHRLASCVRLMLGEVAA